MQFAAKLHHVDAIDGVKLAFASKYFEIENDQ